MELAQCFSVLHGADALVREFAPKKADAPTAARCLEVVDIHCRAVQSQLTRTQARLSLSRALEGCTVGYLDQQSFARFQHSVMDTNTALEHDKEV